MSSPATARGISLCPTSPFLLRDRDAIFGHEFQEQVRAGFIKNAHAWLMARREHGQEEGLRRTKYVGKSKAWPARSRRRRKGTSPRATGPWRRGKDFPWRCNFPLATAGARKSRLSASPLHQRFPAPRSF